MVNPPECKYAREHEWVRLDAEGRALIGITDYAQDQLGDVVFLDLLPVGTEVAQFSKFGEIESVKAVSDLFLPVSGRIIEVNQVAIDDPELVNREPYVRGWLIRVELSNPTELETLLSAAAYEAFLAEASSVESS